MVAPPSGQLAPARRREQGYSADDDLCGKSGLREDLCSAEGFFSPAYFMYVKKKRRKQWANHPQNAEAV